MSNSIDEIATEVDRNINVGDSFLVSDPEAFPKYSLNIEFSLKIIVQNIRSIHKNFDDFKIFLARSNLDYDIIILTECWLKNSDLIPKLEGYNSFHTRKHINQNSGVVVYVKNDLESVTVYEPNLIDVDCLIIKINNSHAFICLYRSPSFVSITNFIESLEKLLEDLKQIPNIYLTGDINIDISKDSSDLKSDEYLNLLATHCLLPSHLFPTRFKKCIDHCFVKSNSRILTVVCESAVTDHNSIYFNVPLTEKRSHNKQKKTRQKLNYEKAFSLLKGTDWAKKISLKDANTASEVFIDTLSEIIEKSSIPITIPNRQQISQPWVTPGLLRCIRFRDTLHKRYIKSPNNKDLELTYKRYRNHCNNILHKLKNEHHKSDLIASRTNIKRTWNVIRRVCNLDTSDKSQMPHELLKLKPTAQESADYINDYFVNIASKLSCNILRKLNLTENDLAGKFECKNSPINSLMLLETDEAEVYKTVMSLKNTQSTGWDGISAAFIKKGIKFLIKPLTHIFNLCLSSGRFPNVLKHSIVIPVFKSGERDIVTNYRPISLLPTVAKILEKIINSRLTSYLEKNKIISENQFGFRKNKSTIDAVENFVNNVAGNVDRKKKCIGVFLDLAKAFDTVSIPLLVCKLEAVGVRGVPLDLFKDYLSNRTQTVKIGNTFSSKLKINFGVPQGSVLGPTLFLIYINNLCNIFIPDSKVITFADDTVILFQDATWSDVKSSAEQGLRVIMNWLDRNLLTLNVTKTKYITFSIKNNLQPSSDFNLKVHSTDCRNAGDCECSFISAADSIKYLGIEIDKHLNWKQHINNLKTRIRKLIPIYKKIRNLKDKVISKTVYFTLCRSIITYGISAWGGARKSNLLEIERAHRCILKVINFKNFRYPTTALYKEFEALNIRQLFIKNIVLRQHHRERPCNKSIRRSHEVYDVPACNTSFAHCFSFFLAPFLYNRISKIKPLKDMTRFVCGKALEEFLCKLDYERTEELLQIYK